MKQDMEEIISQQIAAAIEALSQARDKITSGEISPYLDKAASFIHDIQFNTLQLAAD